MIVTILAFIVAFFTSKCASFHSRRLFIQHRRAIINQLQAEWKASPEEEAALERMLQRANQQRKTITSTKRQESTSSIQQNQLQARPLYEPNNEWRNALDNPFRPKKPTPSKEMKRHRQQFEEYEADLNDNEGEDIEPEFGYEDLAYAMELFESGKLEVAGKYEVPWEMSSEFPDEFEEDDDYEEDGLFSGEVLEINTLNSLLTLSGGPVGVEDICNNSQADILVLFADPRRFNIKFQNVLRELKSIPKNKLRLSIGVVTCSDVSDIKKMLKKQDFAFPIFFDPKRRLMNALECQDEDRLESALALIDIKTKQIIRIWYEDRKWDILKTKDMVVEAIHEYRRDGEKYFDKYIR